MSESIEINGLPLPSGLVDAIAKGVWRTPRAIEAWYGVFPAGEVVRPRLYGLAQLKSVNSQWVRETDPVYIGRAGKTCRPGNLDPRRSLLIGELQPDALIGLDYRESPTCPSVVYLVSSDEGWSQVAPSIDCLVAALRLEEAMD
jgi:hypothetical protein